ncbi:hypothetical protein CYMTET_54551 [Cymbomonas tetramitiformis]|uniref:Uncharacterized protein n=1 Tax=Cymbomonas tetramitiformis TaxID=36881 RepID=A0AAE0EP82_9CHLO|nr:hypothetical protein CYMTET_54551 [Cymbomonas tetramitiformis]
MPAGYHESRLGSSKWWDAENAAIRMYNLKNRFKNSEWGILVTDWQQLSNEEKDKYRAKPPPADKQKSPTGNSDSLKADYQGMVAARKTASRAGSVKSQVLSEDEGSDEELVASNVAEREVYISDTHEVNHREITGPGLPSGSSPSVLSALAEEMGEEVLSDALNTLGLGGLPEALNMEDDLEVMAAPAVALGSTHHMRGFPVKTPEEYEAEAQVPLAPAADEMQRKVQLMASVIKILGAAFRKLAVGLVAEGRITAPRGVETLVELAETGQLPMPAALAADVDDRQSSGEGDGDDDEDDDCPGMESGDDSDDEGDDCPGMESGDDSDEEAIPLDEMPEDMVDQPRKERVTVRVTAAAATIQDKFGVTNFSGRGELHAGTMEAKAYELLKRKMLSGLTEEQLTAMAQVQPVCKLLNETLAQGMALVASGGLLMLYKALLLDTGANCNIIPIRTVNQLGLTIFDAETGARVARCDGSPAESTKYCYVDVILAAGTPYMTLHRLHAFVTFTNDTTWDFLVGTGPLKNALKLTIDLYRGIATSEAAVSLGMREKVTLPLIELTPPADVRSKRNEDPRVCLATEIFDDRAPLRHEIALAESAGENRLALSGERCAFSRGHPGLAHLLESFLEELRLKRFNQEEREMLDARCQSMVEAGVLRPSSLMQAELTGRVSLHVESSRFKPPAPGTSVTDQMLNLLQATSCSQREANNVATRSEWADAEEPVSVTPITPARLTATQTDPRYPDLTQEQEAGSDSEYVVGQHATVGGHGGEPMGRLEAGFVRVTFARCGEEKDVLETELLWPDFTLVDQKVDKETKVASDTWATRASWRKDSDQVALPDCQAHRDAGRYTMADVQEALSAQQVYPTGVVTGTLMWDRRAHQFCVLSEKTRVQWELMEKMVRHTMAGSVSMSPMGRVTGEFQLPFYYEGDQRWRYQPLKYVQKVDIANLRARLKVKYDEVVAGKQAIPLLTLSGVTCKVGKFYPVTDGEGGDGEVFNTNAAALEFLHLGEGRVMLSASSAPLRLRHQTWPNGEFDPQSREYQPSVFQSTYEPESDTNSESTTQESTWMNPSEIAEFAELDGQTVFLSRGCTGGLLGTIRMHVAGLGTGEELVKIAKSHLVDGPQQGTLRVLKTRATPRSKAVYYLCEDHSYYHTRGSYGVVFTLEYLSSRTRKSERCSWMTWDRSAVMHRAPLSALAALVAGPTMRAEETRRTELRTQLRSEFLSNVDTTAEGVTPTTSGAPPSPIPSQPGEDGDSLYRQGGGDEEVDSASGRSPNLACGGLIRAAIARLNVSIAERTEIISRHEETLREYRDRPLTARPSVRMGQGTSGDAGPDGRHGTRSQPENEAGASDAFGGLRSGGLEVNFAQRPEHRHHKPLTPRSAQQPSAGGRSYPQAPVPRVRANGMDVAQTRPLGPHTNAPRGAASAGGDLRAPEERSPSVLEPLAASAWTGAQPVQQLPRLAVVVIWAAMEVMRCLGKMAALWVAGFHHARRGLWYVPLLRLGLVVLAMHFGVAVVSLGHVLVMAIHVGRHGLLGARMTCGGRGLAALQTQVNRALALAQQCGRRLGPYARGVEDADLHTDPALSS